MSSTLDKSYFTRAIKEFGGKGIVVVVEVHKNSLEFDRNNISYGSKNNKELSKEDLLFESLTSLFGACKYRGSIRPENFRGIYDSQGEKIN